MPFGISEYLAKGASTTPTQQPKIGSLTHLEMGMSNMSSSQSVPMRPAWLSAFLWGAQQGLEACYRENFTTVDDAVGAILSGADRDTVVHEIFYKLMTRSELRNSFAGNDFPAWLRAVARNHAIDFARRRGREVPCPKVTTEQPHGAASSHEGPLAARETIEKLRDNLPVRLRSIFDARCIQQQTQRQAAGTLGMPRTTLARLERRMRLRISELARRLEA